MFRLAFVLGFLAAPVAALAACPQDKAVYRHETTGTEIKGEKIGTFSKDGVPFTALVFQGKAQKLAAVGSTASYFYVADMDKLPSVKWTSNGEGLDWFRLVDAEGASGEWRLASCRE